MEDRVKRPKHYQVLGKLEAIEVIASALTPEQWFGYCVGNKLKYHLRAGKKDDLQQDIAKAAEYELLYEQLKDTCKPAGA